jgi:hypothetical protein
VSLRSGAHHPQARRQKSALQKSAQAEGHGSKKTKRRVLDTKRVGRVDAWLRASGSRMALRRACANAAGRRLRRALDTEARAAGRTPDPGPPGAGSRCATFAQTPPGCTYCLTPPPCLGQAVGGIATGVVWTCLLLSLAGWKCALSCSLGSQHSGNCTGTAETTATPCWDASGRLLCSALSCSIQLACANTAHQHATASAACQFGTAVAAGARLAVDKKFDSSRRNYGLRT